MDTHVQDWYGEDLTIPADREVHWRPSIYGILQNSKGECLIAKTIHARGYDFPGGGMEPRETLEEALKREFLEETGVVMKSIGPVKHVAEGFGHIKRKDKYEHRLMYGAEVFVEDGFDFDEVIESYAYDEQISELLWVSPEKLVDMPLQMPARAIVNTFFNL